MPVFLAEYQRRQIVRDRNLEALLKWSAYITQSTPTNKPPEDEVRLRLVAERIAMRGAQYAAAMLLFFWRDETTQTNIRQYLSDLNTEAEEATLADQLTGIIARFMPAFARQDVTESMVQQWYRDNGFAEPEPAPEP